jgi:N-methylhydantoinase B
MGAVLRRTAYSPNIKERADCSAAVFTADGTMLAQAEHIPVISGRCPLRWRPCSGDWGRTRGAVRGQRPVRRGHASERPHDRRTRVRGRVHVAWVGNRAHHADVGGEAPGSMPAHATSVDQEGIRVAPMEAVRDGDWLAPFLEPFLDATRTPEERRGDLAAQLGANEWPPSDSGRWSVWRGRTGSAASRCAARIRRATDGGGARSHPRRPLRVLRLHGVGGPRRDDLGRRHVDGGTLHADFTGTDPQIPPTSTRSRRSRSPVCTTRCASPPTRHPCQRRRLSGHHAHAPPGSIVNAPSAAVAAGNVETSQRIADVVSAHSPRPCPTVFRRRRRAR